MVVEVEEVVVVVVVVMVVVLVVLMVVVVMVVVMVVVVVVDVIVFVFVVVVVVMVFNFGVESFLYAEERKWRLHQHTRIIIHLETKVSVYYAILFTQFHIVIQWKFPSYVGFE